MAETEMIEGAKRSTLAQLADWTAEADQACSCSDRDWSGPAEAGIPSRHGGWHRFPVIARSRRLA